MNKFKLTFILSILILSIFCISIEKFTNEYTSQNVLLSKFYTDPYILTYNNEDNIVSILTKYLPLETIQFINDIDRYNDFINNDIDFTIVHRRLLDDNDNFNIISDVDKSYIYLIVQSDSDIYSFQDCINKKIVIDKENTLTNNISKSIFSLLKIEDQITFIENSIDDLNTHEEFYNDNLYDGIMIENKYNDDLNFYKDKNIRIVTGDLDINKIDNDDILLTKTINEQDLLIDLLNYDNSIHNIQKRKLLLINDYYNPLNENLYENFLSDNYVLICKEDINESFIYTLTKILFDKNITTFDKNTNNIDRKTHPGTLRYLMEYGYISYNDNEDCKYYMSNTYCPLEEL